MVYKVILKNEIVAGVAWKRYFADTIPLFVKVEVRGRAEVKIVDVLEFDAVFNILVIQIV